MIRLQYAPMPQAQATEWYADGLRFTCTQCGDCCSGAPGYVWFTPEEAQAMAAELKLTVEQFLEQYAKAYGEKWSLRDHRTRHGYDCVFLTRDEQGRGRCSVYKVRPMQCRTWPFWPENLRNERSYLDAAKKCPGTAAGLQGKGKFFPVEQIRILRDATQPDDY